MKVFICVVLLLCVPVLCSALSVMQYQGLYHAGAVYGNQDVVKYNNSVYVCFAESCALVPGSLNSGWDILFKATTTGKK